MKTNIVLIAIIIGLITLLLSDILKKKEPTSHESNVTQRIASHVAIENEEANISFSRYETIETMQEGKFNEVP